MLALSSTARQLRHMETDGCRITTQRADTTPRRQFQKMILFQVDMPVM